MSMLKKGRVGIAIAYVIGAWMYGLIFVVSNSEQYTYIGGTLWSILWRSLSWPYWLVVAVI
ncbi:MAG: hypothetical protein IIA72_12520 [Proteobacteria bacterium]|nr:hypothetical protein [Pseudomonadota bacterium]